MEYVKKPFSTPSLASFLPWIRKFNLSNIDKKRNMQHFLQFEWRNTVIALHKMIQEHFWPTFNKCSEAWWTWMCSMLRIPMGRGNLECNVNE